MKYIISFIFSVLVISAFCQNYSHEFIYSATNCEINDNKLIVDIQTLIQINNREGDWAARIGIPYTRKNKIVNLSARIEDMRGNVIRKLKNNDVHAVSAISDNALYEDDFIKRFELRHNNYPYRIRYSYRKVFEDFLTITDWTPVMDMNVPTKLAQLNVTLPLGYEVNIYEQNVNGMTADTANGYVRYSWNESYETILKEEMFSPPLEDVIPNVKIAPKHFKYGINGSADSWISFGNWLYQMNKGLDVLPEIEQQKIKGIISGITESKEIIRRLYHYLQDNTRYINVKIDLGGLKTYPAEYVALNKYGDCKALTNYMKSLLKQVDIDSYYTLVYAGNRPLKIIENYPTNQFNHVILSVPFKNDTIWLECTDKSIPFGYTGTFIQNRHALIIDDNNSHLICTPAMKLNENKMIRKIIFEGITKKNSSVKLHYTFKGSYFEPLNHFYTFLNKTQQEHQIREFIPFTDFELITWDLKKAGRDSACIDLSVDLRVNNPGRYYGDEILLPLITFDFPKIEPPLKRKLPVKINYPENILDTCIFTLPSWSTTTTSYKDTLINSDFGTYSIQTSHQKDRMEIIKKLVIYAGDYALDKYPEFFNFYNELKMLENTNTLILSNNQKP